MLRQRGLSEDKSAIGFGVPRSSDKNCVDDHWRGMVVLSINGDGTVSVGMCVVPSNQTFFHFAEAITAARDWVTENNYRFRGSLTEVAVLPAKVGHKDVHKH